MSETVIKNPPWWNRRSILEKSLITIIALLMITSLILAIALLLILLRTPVEICMTTECVESASDLLKRMNKNVNPCDNFYEFACGNFANIVAIPKMRTSVTSLTMIEDQVQGQLRALLEEPIKDNEPKAFKAAKTFFKTCTNLTKIEELGLEPIKKTLSELGGWPILEGNKWNEENFDWKTLNYKLKTLGLSFNHLVNLYIGIDIKNTKRRVLQLFQANLELPREYLIVDLNHKVMKAYYQFMIDMTLIFDVDKTVAEKELMDALLFQRKLADISLSQTELRNASALYNPMTIDELQNMHPSIPWLEYINNILSPVIQVNSSEIIINKIPSFITELENLLKETPKRTIANYLFWHVVRYSISTLPEKAQKAQLKYLNSAIGVTEIDPRWKRCVSSTTNNFDLIVGALYVRKHFDKESKNKATEIVNDIKDVFMENLKSIEWMDDKTRIMALGKAKTIDTHVGYPEELLNDQKIEQYYEELEINATSLLELTLKINRWGTNIVFNLLRKPVNRTDWTEHGNSANVGAYYVSIENSILIPAGILQGKLFSSHRPNYLNYGAIGFTIGHEITHGFDNEGRQFNKDGNVVDWWQKSTEEAFLKKAQCVIDQYSNYLVREINQTIDGDLTQGENIADNGGIKQSYLAYKKYLHRTQKQEPRLPGLEYTPLQMFWISMASTWCSKDRPDHLKVLLDTDVHAPYYFRINGVMSNRPEFAKDFNCPVGVQMNPKDKCQVW